MYRITHINRDIDGNIYEVMLDNGDILDYLEAFDLASQGLIEGVVDSQHIQGYPQLRPINQHWDEYLKTVPSF